MGRRRECPLEVVEQVVWLHLQRMTRRAVAAEMMARGVPTPMKNRIWYPNTVQALLKSKAGNEALARAYLKNPAATSARRLGHGCRVRPFAD